MTMAAPAEPADGQAVTFFNIAKQIPKGVKRHCGMCRQHGVVAQTRNHSCPFKNCECTKCNLVRQRRSIMSMQIRLRREQDKMFVRTNEPGQAEIVPPTKASETPSACYFCQKCKNHGVLKWKKDHKKNCQFANCSCGQCELIDTRRALDSHIKKGRKRVCSDDEPKTDGEFHVEAEMCASSMASSPTVSDGRTPSITEFELSQSLSALGYSTLPEMKVDFSATVPFLTVAPTQPTFNEQYLSTDMSLQKLAQQAASYSIPQSTVSPTPTVISSPTVSTPSVPSLMEPFPSSLADAVSGIQYLNLVQHQTQPTIYIQNPVLYSLPQTTVNPISLTNTVLPNFSQMDIHNLVSSLMLNSRV